MNETEAVLHVENVKKKYVIKHLPKMPNGKIERAKFKLHSIAKHQKLVTKEDFWALNGVSFDVKQGEKLGILGKNGAGKSTLLKVISRITEPTDGKIEFYGKISSMLEVGTGFNSELTGRENIYLNGAILGMTKAEIDSKFDDILLVDEVLAVGDTRFQQKCIEKMRSIADSGKTILFVSHQMNTIRQLCDRVIVLKEGQVIYDGDVEDGIRVYNSESYMEKRNYYEYKDLPRPPGYTLDNAEILSLEVLRNETCIYGAYEPIEFRVRFKTKTPHIGDLSFRLLIWTVDEVPAETAFAKTFANINDVGEYTVDFKINKHNLAPGVYKMTLILTGGSSENTRDNFDHIYPAFVFEVLHFNGTSKNWLRNWGLVHFDDVDVTLIDKE